MTNRDREQIIKNAIGEYKAAIVSWQPVKKEKIVNAINMMQNAYIMCSNWNVKGTEELRQTIIEAEKKLTEMENNMEIVGRYKTDMEEIVISQYPNGLYYIHYGWMEKQNRGVCIAGGFETLEEAEKMLMKHRPNVKGIEMEKAIRAARKVVDYFKYHNKNTTKAQDAMLDELEEALQFLK